MKCPLLKIARAGLVSEAARPLDDCLKEECAWWDAQMEQCSINGLEPTLQHIALSLRDLVTKMPHEG